MVEELDELITDMQAISNLCDNDVAGEIASHAADLLAALKNIMPSPLHKRRCFGCGRVAYHTDNVLPHSRCAKCGSDNTQVVPTRVASVG